MNPEKIEFVLGAPNRVSKNAMGNRVEFRDSFSQSCIYEKGTQRLIEIAFSSLSDVVFYEGNDLIAHSSNEVARFLFEHDKSALTGFGSIVFKEIGIALTGYLPEDNTIKAVSAFTIGRWDLIAGKMKPLKL